jgi:cytosine/adenosine deaminase-related metal-dependent hydrolase
MLRRKMFADAENHPWDRVPIVIDGVRYANGPYEALSGTLQVADGKIVEIASGQSLESRRAIQIDLKGFLVMPGFVNAHDHLHYALHPRIGVGPYSDYIEWGKDIHENLQPLISHYNAVPKDVRLWWGGLRSLLSGVTTVCHHDKLWTTLFADDYPIKVLRTYGWAHSIQLSSDIRLAWESTPEDRAFVIHACEGTSECARSELNKLERLRMLDERTVLVHGLALDSTGVDLLRRRSSSLVLCLSSNDFLYARLPKWSCLRSMQRVALGSDSPLTSAGDLLDEVRFASEHAGISSERGYSMITDIPAEILRLSHGEGYIRESASADLIAVRDNGRRPHEHLRMLSWRDIEFVMVAGKVQLASDRVWRTLPAIVRVGMEAIWVDGEKRWLRAPVEQLFHAAAAYLGSDGVKLNGRLVQLDPPANSFDGKTGYSQFDEIGRS